VVVVVLREQQVALVVLAEQAISLLAEQGLLVAEVAVLEYSQLEEMLLQILVVRVAQVVAVEAVLLLT
jgi:hypothetical protein